MNNSEPTKNDKHLSTTVKKKLFLEALKSCLGVITPAMQRVGIASRTTIKNWRDKDKKFATAMAEIEATAGDFVETELYRKIKGGDTTAIIFYCKTKLKDRGYTERAELTGKDGKDLLAFKTDEELDKEIEELTRKLS